LNIALWLSYTTFTHPLQALLTTIYVGWTKRQWGFDILHYFDMIQSLLVLAWAFYFYDLSFWRVPDEARWEGVIVETDRYHNFLMNAADLHEGV
jgi:hypothetical protein